MMTTEVQDRDAIFSRAIAMASPEEREAYLSQACGDDAVLRREVEEMLAAQRQARNAQDHQPPSPAPAPLPPQRVPQPAGGSPPDGQATEARRYSRRLTTLLLAAVAGGCVGLAVWAWRGDNHAQAEAEQAQEQRDEARKEAAAARDLRSHTEAELQAMRKARDSARSKVPNAQRLEKDARDVLEFFREKVLTAARPKSDGGLGKDVTLRQAVDAAEVEVDKAFPDRPLAEASVRELLGSSYRDLGQPALAVAQLERALALREAVLGPDNSATGDCRNQLAVAYRDAGRPADASRLYNESPDSPSHAAALAVMGSILLSQHKPHEAELKLRDCLAIRRRIEPGDWTTFDVKSLLGEALLLQKQYAAAEPLLLSGYEGMKQRAAKIPPESRSHLTRALERLVRLYEAWGKEDKAARWRKTLLAAKAPKKTDRHTD